MTAMPRLIDPTNADQARAWDGTEGDYWADHADAFDRTMAGYDPVLLDAAALHPGEHVLDIGCGTGAVTRAAARLCAPGHAVGLDLSARMVEVARAGAAGLVNASFQQADAQVHDVGTGLYDVLLSRTGVMFFGDPVAAFANLARALKPDGRMVLAVWQPLAENEWLSEFRRAVDAGRDIPLPTPDGPGPFSMGDADRVRAVLTAAGFAEPELVGVREPMYYGPDVATAEAFVLGMVGGALTELDDAARADAMAALRATLEAHLHKDGVMYRSAMWIVTAELAT
jgi:SAM-dependent methyltransferase